MPPFMANDYQVSFNSISPQKLKGVENLGVSLTRL